MEFPFVYTLDGHPICIGLSDKEHEGCRIYSVTLCSDPVTIIGIYKNNEIWYPLDRRSTAVALRIGKIIDTLEKFDFVIQWGGLSVAVKPIEGGQFTSYNIRLPDGKNKILSYHIEQVSITWHFNSDKPSTEAKELGKLVENHYQSAIQSGM
jgi:hypothetical protein